jgi:hypothetical protein
LWGNDLARTAPSRKGVENDDLVILEGGVELLLAASHQLPWHNAMKEADSPGEIVDNHVHGG